MDHPIEFLKPLAANYPDATFHFKMYRPIKFPSPEEIVGTAAFRSGELVNVDKLLKNLPEGVELALLSEVTFEFSTMHIPMIDFATTNPEEAEDVPGALLLPDNLGATYTVFKSGKSFHGYFDCLLHKGEWVKYMGRLLLIDIPSQKTPTVDWRWVGHSLNHGHSGLRWSGNTERHTAAPRKIRDEDYVTEESSTSRLGMFSVSCVKLLTY